MRHLAQIAFVVAVLATVGCNRTATETAQQDFSRARETLVVALDAWKQGKAPSLARRDPPIRFVDDDCVAGWQLSDFEIPDDKAGRNTKVTSLRANLTLDRNGSPTVRRAAMYQISFEPRLTVLRADP